MVDGGVTVAERENRIMAAHDTLFRAEHAWSQKEAHTPAETKDYASIREEANASVRDLIEADPTYDPAPISARCGDLRRAIFAELDAE